MALEDINTIPGDAIREPDTVTVEADPLKLQLEDDDLIRVIDERIEKANAFYKDKDIPARRKKNKEYLFGDQINIDSLKFYNARYVDNLIYESENTIKPIALSRLPDLLSKPGNESEESKKNAEVMTNVINNDLRQRENRQVLGLSFKHLPVYFIGAIKALWDPEMGDNGDYRFKVIHPENLVLDHTAASNNPADMDLIAEATELSIKEVVMRFPAKEEEILKAVKAENKEFDKKKEKDMASKIKIWEVWFTWYDSAVDEETGEKKWERIEGVVWKYDRVLLAKMKNPYWDWEGKRRLFKFDTDGKKRDLNDEEIRQSIFGEEDADSETIFRNFFSDPQKPYIFIGYDQWGEMPLDETSRIEQVIFMQDNVNKRGRQITEMNDRAKGKHIFSTESGLTKTDVENMDMSNPDEDIIVEGSVRDVHTFVPGTPATPGLYKEQESERQKVFSKMGTHSTTRGERESQETATGRQLLREADFGRIDDLVEETVNHAAEQMAAWAMQFIKLFYTSTHMRKLVGDDGQITFQSITQDNIEDGMEVIVTASGVDKAERKREAFERARMKLTDPLTFFIDTDSSDPIGRTEKLLLFMNAPELYIQKFIEKRDTQGMVDALNEEPIQGEGVPTGDAAQAFGAIPEGGQPTQEGLPAGGGAEGNGLQPLNFDRHMEFIKGFGGGGKGYTD